MSRVDKKSLKIKLYDTDDSSSSTETETEEPKTTKKAAASPVDSSKTSELDGRVSRTDYNKPSKSNSNEQSNGKKSSSVVR